MSRRPTRLLTVSAGRERGVSLISAIFLLVVLTGLGVALVTISTSQSIGSAMDVQGARAYQAARAGIEWGLYKQAPQATPKACVFSSTTFKLPAGTTLSTFTVTVTCKDGSQDTPLLRHRLTAVACNQPSTVCPNPSNSVDYVQRRIQVDF